MYDFNYHRPTSIDQALEIFSNSEDASYLAGGHTLLPSMKQRLAAPTDIIDLGGISSLEGIKSESDELVIGALTNHDEVATSALVSSEIPSIAKLASNIGDAQVRNRGTIGGSIANSDPAADYPAAVLGLGARLVTNKRVIKADDFFVDMFETALEEGEILQEIKFPKPDMSAYQKLPNPASRYAVVGVFIASRNGSVRVAITGAAPSVFRAPELESRLSESFSVEAIENVTLERELMNDDMHASAAYRASLCVVMAKRAVADILKIS